MIEVLENKLPPHSNESEIVILGSLLIDKDSILKITDIITADSFYNEANKKIYSTILDLYSKDKNYDLVSLAEELNKRKLLTQIGGAAYLSEINTRVPTAANIETHARIIQEKFIKREHILVATKWLSDSYDISADVFETTANLLTEINKNTINLLQSETLSPKEWTQKLYVKIEEDWKGKEKGIPTEIYELDKILQGGFQDGHFVVIAGSTSAGKTSVIIDIIKKNKNIPVAFFSLDQTNLDLALRLLTNDTEIESKVWKQIDYPLTDPDRNKMLKSLADFNDGNIYLNDNSWDIDDLYLHCLSMAKKYGLRYIVIDYIGQLGSRVNVKNSRERHMTYIAERLKQLAKKLDIPVIGLVQLNRVVESRINKRPLLNDLRESGAIEQAANVAIFMYNPFKYGIKEFPKGSKFQGKSSENHVEIIIAKQKDGETGSVLVHYVPSLYKYSSPEQERLDEAQKHFQDKDDVPF